MDAAEDNESRVMLSPLSLVACAPLSRAEPRRAFNASHASFDLYPACLYNQRTKQMQQDYSPMRVQVREQRTTGVGV